MATYFVSYRSKVFKSSYVHKISGELLELSVGHGFWGVGIFKRVDLDPFLGVQCEVAALQSRLIGELGSQSEEGTTPDRQREQCCLHH